MNSNKIFRVVVALLMVFCLVINISPVRAHAASLVYSSVAIDSWNVIASILIGLGLMAGTTTTDFSQIVDLVVSALNLGDVINVISWVASGFQRYAVPQSLVESVRSVLFSSSVLNEEFDKTTCLSGGTSFVSSSYGNCTILSDCYAFGYRYGNLSSRSVILIPFDLDSARTLVVFEDGSTPNVSSKITSDFGRVRYLAIGCHYSVLDDLGLNLVQNTSGADNAVVDFLSGSFSFSPEIVVSSPYDVSLGDVGSVSTTLDESYPVWIDGSVSISGDDSTEDDERYLVVGLGQTMEETSIFTQEQVQSGESTYIDSSVDAVTSTWLGNWFNSIISTFSTWFNNVISSVQAIPGAFSTWFQDVISLLQSIPGTILSGIQAIFVPSADFVTAKVEALRARFDFINVFMDFIDSFKGELSGATPPVIYVHLENAEGSYNYGGTVKFLDMFWYSRYKSTGDAIISGFLWALFGWRMYLKLPGIINGVSGSVGAFNKFNRDGE